MNWTQDQLSEPSGSTQSMQPPFPATVTGHSNRPHAPVHQAHSINPLNILINPSKAYTRPYRYSSHPYRTHAPPYSPNISSSTPTPSHTTATPSPVLSVRTQSTRHSSLQPPSKRPLPTQPSSIPISHDDTRSIPSKRARNYTPIPRTSYTASPQLPPHLHLPSPQLPLIEASSKRPAKRPRLDAGRSSTTTNHRSSQQPVFLQPPRPKPKPKKTPLHPLAVDYGRPIKPVVPQPPFCLLSLQKNHIPLPPSPEIPDPKRLLDDELKGPVDSAISRELGDLMWMQQRRVWNNRGGYSDPFLLLPIPAPVLSTSSSGSRKEATPPQSRPETITLYGPPPRNNESTRLGESLTNPNVIVLDDEEDDGFEEVLELYRGAVQGSTLSVELEFVVGDDAGLTTVGWGDVSSLEVSVRCRSPVSPSAEEPPGSRIRTLVEYKEVVQAEKRQSSLKPAVPKEDPPLGIEWSYSSCGYATGKVVSSQKARKPFHQHPAPSAGWSCRH